MMRWPLPLLALALGCTSPGTPAADAGHSRDLAHDLSPYDAVSDLAPEAGESGDAQPDVLRAPPTFDEAVFRATHNSYSGGLRGSIPAQLAGGVRFIELDVHADNFDSVGYQIGHDAPSHEVAFGDQNPEDDDLLSWLDMLATWHRSTGDHLPLTLGIDVKDDLSARVAGDILHLESLFVDAFGEAIFGPTDLAGDWPTVESMRGRVVLVLSGDQNTRLHYHRTVTRPAMFTEVQHDGDPELETANLRFFAGNAYLDASRDWATQRRAEGGVVRLWNFNLPTLVTDPPPNFPATDFPDKEWYSELCASIACQ